MKVYFYILDTMADWEYGFLLAELNSKRYFLSSKKNLEIITVSNDKNSKTSMGGFKIIPDIKNLKVFSDETLNNWFGLYDKKEAKYFYGLMKSLENNRPRLQIQL